MTPVAFNWSAVQDGGPAGAVDDGGGAGCDDDGGGCDDEGGRFVFDGVAVFEGFDVVGLGDGLELVDDGGADGELTGVVFGTPAPSPAPVIDDVHAAVASTTTSTTATAAATTRPAGYRLNCRSAGRSSRAGCWA